MFSIMKCMSGSSVDGTQRVDPEGFVDDKNCCAVIAVMSRGNLAVGSSCMLVLRKERCEAPTARGLEFIQYVKALDRGGAKMHWAGGTSRSGETSTG